MRTKKWLTLVMATSLAFSMAACSSDSDEDSGTDAEQSTTESTVDEGADSGSDAGGDEGSDSGSGEDASGDELPLNLGDCLEVSMAYAGIYLSVLGGEDAIAEAQTALDEIKGDVPEDIQDDLDVIADGISDAGNLSDLNEFFESDEYTEADAAITTYFEEECGG